MALNETAVQALIDRQAILDVLARYTRGMDRHDEEMIRSAYHPDALDERGSFTGGPEEIARRVTQLHADNWRAHMHYVTNVVLDIDGDEAHGESYWFVCLRHKQGGGVDIGGGRYVDRLERRDGAWGIAHRVVVSEWNATVEGGAATEDFDATLLTFATGRWDRKDVSYQRPLRRLEARG